MTPRSQLIKATLRAVLESLFLLLVCIPAQGQGAPTASESQVKAAYLHKFPGFVDWPPGSFLSDSSPIVIGVTGSDSVYQDLTRLAEGRLVQGRPLEVRWVVLPLSRPLVHVLYIGRDARANAGAFISQTAGHPVLTVTDYPLAPPDGAVLNLLEMDGRIRFEASLPAASANGIKLSARLLNVAARVKDKVP